MNECDAPIEPLRRTARKKLFQMPYLLSCVSMIIFGASISPVVNARPKDNLLGYVLVKMDSEFLFL